MNTNAQPVGIKLSPRPSPANSLRDRLIASLAAWFSRCDEDRIYL